VLVNRCTSVLPAGRQRPAARLGEDVLLTREHIIPRQIGGRLWARFVCGDCNSALGYTVETEVKNDPPIRLAAEQLRDQIPDLAEAIREGQDFILEGEAGAERVRQRRGRIQVRSRQAEDGSIIQPTPVARDHIRKDLGKRGLPKKEIDAVLLRFDDLPENLTVTPATGLSVVKWRIDSVHPALNGPLLSTTALLKIAFEFLACQCGDSIYGETP